MASYLTMSRTLMKLNPCSNHLNQQQAPRRTFHQDINVRVQTLHALPPWFGWYSVVLSHSGRASTGRGRRKLAHSVPIKDDTRTTKVKPNQPPARSNPSLPNVTKPSNQISQTQADDAGEWEWAYEYEEKEGTVGMLSIRVARSVTYV